MKEYTKEQIRNMGLSEKIKLAQDPNIEDSVFDVLIEDTSEINDEVRQEVACNLNVPIRILVSLANDDFDEVRYQVAINPKTPNSVLERLARDEIWAVRDNVAANDKSSAKTLVAVFDFERSFDNDTYTLRTLLRNPNCPDYLKAVLGTLISERSS